MKMIELEYKQKSPLLKRKKVIFLGGFELEAPKAYNFNVAGPVRKGQLTTQFRLDIPVDGLCEIPDTTWNREKLKNKFDEKNGVKYYPFNILSDINLDEEAPHAGGGAISKDEERSLKQQISDLKEKNLRLDGDLKVAKEAKKKENKKTGGKAKKEEKDKAPEALELEPDLV